MDQAPTHILLQAGVGGFAAAMAAHFRDRWGDAPEIICVEPEAAPALQLSIEIAGMATAEGPVSDMGRLDCKTPSTIGLRGLSRDADRFVTISEEDAQRTVNTLAQYDVPTTPSGAAGIAAALSGLDFPADAQVLAFITEGPEDA